MSSTPSDDKRAQIAERRARRPKVEDTPAAPEPLQVPDGLPVASAPQEPQPLTDEGRAAIEAAKSVQDAAETARQVLQKQLDPKQADPSTADFKNAVAAVLLADD